MSRTWRKAPGRAGKPAAFPTRARTGGATASYGPSRARLRPDTDHDETLSLAAELLEHAAAALAQTTEPQLLMLAVAGPSKAQQLLWHLAVDSDCPAELLVPTMQIAQQSIKEIAYGNDPTYSASDLFAQASEFLNAIASSGREPALASAAREMVPDGRQRESHIRYWRDTRVTGLRSRDHRRARREARQGLADPESAEAVRAGKHRRYTDRHGDYNL